MYMTNYDLTILEGIDPNTDPTVIQALNDRINSMPAFECRQGNAKSGWYTETDWYDHNDDMLAISKDFPGLLFVLSGTGEDRDDQWVAYFHDGKMAEYAPVVTWPVFRPSDLREPNDPEPETEQTMPDIVKNTPAGDLRICFDPEDGTHLSVDLKDADGVHPLVSFWEKEKDGAPVIVTGVRGHAFLIQDTDNGQLLAHMTEGAQPPAVRVDLWPTDAGSPSDGYNVQIDESNPYGLTVEKSRKESEGDR